MGLSKNKVILFIFVSVLLLLPGPMARAAVADHIQKEIEYETADPEDRKETAFPERFEQDGTVYIRDHINYKTVKETPVKEKRTVFLTRQSDVIRNAEDYSPDAVLQENGITYQFVRMSGMKKTLEKGYTQKVTGHSEFDSKQAAEQAPETKRIQTKDARTGETIYVTCKKKGNVEKTAPVWVNTYIDINFISYDADHFIWNDVLVKKDTEEPLKGYHKELLQSVGGDSRNYKIQRISWSGKGYRNKNGVLCRKARAYVRKKIPHYQVTYSGTRNIKAVKGTVFTSIYAGEQEIDSGKKTYSILASATYQAQENPVAILKISLGILAALLVVVGILFFLFPKRKKSGRLEQERKK